MSIGIGIVTFNRPEYFRRCINSLVKNNFGGATHLYAIDDCSNKKYKDFYNTIFAFAKKQGVKVIKNRSNKGVGFSKNRLLKAMMDDGCEHLFIMEDDILMKDSNTCHKYISYAKMVGVEHTNFALHGNMNVGKRSVYKGVCIYPQCVGAFSYYTRNVIEKIGFIDEHFVNAWEHVELTYRIAEAGLTTPFWYFADYPYSGDLLEEIPGSIDNSSIRPLDSWKSNISDGQKYWVKKHHKWLPPRVE